MPPLASLYGVARWTGECAFVVLLTMWLVTALVAMADEWRAAWAEDAYAVVVVATCLGIALGLVAGVHRYS